MEEQPGRKRLPAHRWRGYRMKWYPRFVLLEMLFHKHSILRTKNRIAVLSPYFSLRGGLCLFLR